MQRAETSDGEVKGVANVAGGILYFVTRDGVAVEAVAVDAAGRFRHALPHGSDRRAVLVSRSHALAVMPLPPAGPLQLTFPASPSRPIVVRTPADSDYEVALAIGGVVIPAAALSRHQGFRGLSFYAEKGELVIPDVVPAEPMVVYRGFAAGQRPPHLPPHVDVFASPELRPGFASAPVGDGPVIFR